MSTTTDIDDLESRDLADKGLKLIQVLKANELRDPENLLRIMLETLDGFRLDWSTKAYAKGFAEGVAETLEASEKPVVRGVSEGASE